MQGSNAGPDVPGRRERKKLEVRDRIWTCALELFREKGYEATTVEEIAERAEVAKGTFFNHFERKDSLLELLAEEMLARVRADLGAPEEWQGDVREQLLRYFRWIGESISREPELTKVMMIENLRTFWMRTETTEIEMAWHQVLPEILERAVERGELPATTDVVLTGNLLEAAQVFTTVEWLKRGGAVREYEEQVRQKVDIILRGVGATLSARGEAEV